MKVLLVNPSTVEGRESAVSVEGAWPPLGLLYLATMLEKNGVSVSFFDNGPFGYRPERILEWIKDEDPDIVGFHTLSMSSLTANKIAMLVKEEMPDVKVVYGGYHATINHERILREKPFVDIVVRGEGEYTFLEVVETVEKDKTLKGTKGVSFRQDGKIRVNPSYPPVKDLDTIPFPNRGYLSCKYNGEINGIKTAVRQFTSVITSRGCPYRCRFCCESIHEFKMWRSRSPENVVEELLYLREQGYGQVYFVDDSFTVSQKRVLRLCQLIRREKLDMIWAAETRVSHANKELLQNMKKAGCQALFFGVESAVPWVLKYYQKMITPDMAKEAIKNCREVRMDSYAGFILGAPGETLSDMWTTIRFAQKLGIDFPNFYILYAYPGTPIWNELLAKNYINDDNYWETGFVVPEVVPDCAPTDEIRRIIRKGYQYIIGHPNFVASQIVKGIGNPFRRAVVRRNLSLNTLRNAIGALLFSKYYY